MELTKKRTKIITTIGPASNTYFVIKQLANAGMTTIRLNFSHGDRTSQLENMKHAKKLSHDINRPISIMLDTKGPEIRVGKIEAGGALIEKDQLITIKTGKNDFVNHIGSKTEFSVSYQMHLDVKKGTKVLFDDGKLVTFVESVHEDSIIVKTINSHFLKTNKRINLPGTEFSLPFLSEKDENDIRFGIEHGINYIAASFTNSAKDVEIIRKILKEEHAEHIKIIPKIESQLGVDNIDEIIKASDGIMVARGDLGLEVPFEDVPIIEKMIILKCGQHAKPSIVATQMLDSMEKHPIPTRAEVTDIYFAVSQGADCTMLSGESASGLFPELSVATMAKIAMRSEKEYYTDPGYKKNLKEAITNINIEEGSWRNEIAADVATRVSGGKYKFVVVLSKTGSLLNSISRLRPNTAIIGVVAKEELIGAFGISAAVFNSVIGPKIYDKIRTNKLIAYKTLNAYNPVNGDKYLVVDDKNIQEFIY